MEDRKYKPFAVTARTEGKPRKLYTRILLVNVEPKNGRMHGAYVNAMWDTGAECCVMTSRLAKELGFNFKQEIPSKGIQEEIKTKYGYAHVALVSNGEMIDTITSVVDADWGEYSFIIGMDLICKGTLAITTTPLDTMLSFVVPSIGKIDFVKIFEKRNIKGKYLPLSSEKEDIVVYHGHEILDLILPKE